MERNGVEWNTYFMEKGGVDILQSNGECRVR